MMQTGDCVFISHMVQMKENDLGADIGFLEDLYIPHGSDERIASCKT